MPPPATARATRSTRSGGCSDADVDPRRIGSSESDGTPRSPRWRAAMAATSALLEALWRRLKFIGTMTIAVVVRVEQPRETALIRGCACDCAVR